MSVHPFVQQHSRSRHFKGSLLTWKNFFFPEAGAFDPFNVCKQVIDTWNVWWYRIQIQSPFHFVTEIKMTSCNFIQQSFCEIFTYFLLVSAQLLTQIVSVFLTQILENKSSFGAKFLTYNLNMSCSRNVKYSEDFFSVRSSFRVLPPFCIPTYDHKHHHFLNMYRELQTLVHHGQSWISNNTRFAKLTKKVVVHMMRPDFHISTSSRRVH